MHSVRSFVILAIIALSIGGCTGFTISITPATPQPPQTLPPAQAAGVVQPSQAVLTSLTFPTPEDAITHYLEGVTEQDAAKILQASAIDEMAAGFDFGFFTDYIQVMILHTMPAPATDPFYVEINKADLAATILKSVKFLTYSLLADEDIEGTTIAKPDADRVRAFVTAVDPSRLSGLAVVTIAIPEPDLMSSARYMENVAQRARFYGADDVTERAVLLSFEGDTYLLGFTLLRYGDNWKISSQSSVLAGTSAFGTATAISPEGFDQLTSGE